MPELTNSMFLFPVGFTEIFEIINSLNNSIAEGVDGINNIFLKLSSPVLSEYLSVLLNKCFSQGCFPAFFKFAKIFRFNNLATSRRYQITFQYLF